MAKTIIVKPVCRNLCDIPMDYETENPKGYYLFRCRRHEKRIGLKIGVDIKKDLLEIIPICRECDLPMKFEGEDPIGYYLYMCPCGNRIGIIIKNNYL